MLVLEALRLQIDETSGKIFSSINIRWEPHSHVLFPVFLFKVAKVGARTWRLRLLVDIWIMTQSRHLQVVALAEIKRERDGKVERAVPKMVIIILVLIDSFHERYRGTNTASDLVKDKARALI